MPGSSRRPHLSPKPGCGRRRRQHQPQVEALEPRTTPSVTMFPSASLHAQAITPDANAVPPFYPADISGAYQFNQIQFHNPLNGQLVAGDGSGQTIAIVDAGDSPTVAQDLA